MSDLKIATFNVEWMVSIFNGLWTDWDGKIPDYFPGKQLGWSIKLEPIEDVRDLCKRISGTIEAVGADILGIQEGPPLKVQMERFVADYLGDKYKVYTSNSRWQTIHVLVENSIDPDVSVQDPNSPEVKALWNDIPYQPWGTIARDERKLQDFHRRPLMLEYKPSGDKRLEILILHTKSKISSLKTQQQWEERERDAVLDALLSRQKLSAEIVRLRKYAEQRIDEIGENHSMVIMGDLNDGPLAEVLEREFLLHNIIDELVGSVLRPRVVLQHAMSEDAVAMSSSTEFLNPFDGQLARVLLDHILLSPGVWKGAGAFRLKPGSCTIENNAYDQHFDEDGHDKRHLRPSDHRPMSAILTY